MIFRKRDKAASSELGAVFFGVDALHKLTFYLLTYLLSIVYRLY